MDPARERREVAPLSAPLPEGLEASVHPLLSLLPPPPGYKAVY